MTSKSNLVKVGEVYSTKEGGSLTVVEYLSAIRIKIVHNDDFLHEMFTSADSIRKGIVKNPFRKHENGFSYTGYGYCHNIEKSRRDNAYSVWKCMNGRALNSHTMRGSRRNSYKDATVCSSWLNFQVFCKFICEDKYYQKGFHLDKDLLVRGNMHYSPETCCFLPHQLNILISVVYDTNNGLPIGVNAKNGYYEAAISYQGKRKRIGKYATPEEASAAYVVTKELYVKQLASEWRGKIEDRAYQALMNWTVY